MKDSARKVPQDEASPINLPLNRVGILNYKMPIMLSWGPIQQNSNADVSIYVDLPSDKRGAHFSRLLMPIISNLADGAEDVPRRVHGVCGQILEMNDYCMTSILKVSTMYLRSYGSSSEPKGYVPYDFEFTSVARKVGDHMDTITLGTTVMTACPCTMEGTRKVLAESNPEYSELIENLPTVTHNQRNRLTLSLTLPEDCEINPIEMIESVESVAGGPLLPVRPERDTDEFVLENHGNPLFVEDVVRRVAVSVCKRVTGIPGNTVVSVSSRSEESIHTHDSYAELKLTVDDIRDASGNQ